MEEILVEGDVGDFLEDVLEKESDKIFLDNNPSSFQPEIDCESPPKFDEYVGEEFEDCDGNIDEDVHVADGKYNFLGENDYEINPLPIVVNGMHIPISIIKSSQDHGEENCAINYTPMGISTAPKEVTPIFVNSSCILLDSDIPSIIGCTNSTLTIEFYFHDSKAVEGGEICWGNEFVDNFWEYIEAVVKKNI
ncbi:hypothetical protein RHSIM_Rhsim07G0160500 [Rhododendron simsii]|uniref:Uncharacterized protein n=1 Tax=Rhododendron simsii TaxID=118357 RepID=A0A834GP70_RHOSS|nr:hypothetical protein RHSIM_Rhsim07G0160500 [Rhododendron simsii]